MLNRGESPLKGEEPGLEELLKKVVAQENFQCTSISRRSQDLDAVTLSIQTPFLNKDDLLPDFSALKEGIRQVGQVPCSPGMLVVLESTITPGTTEGWPARSSKRSPVLAGEDFALAHAPERVMVGRLLRNIREHDRCVGGIDAVSTSGQPTLYPVLTLGKVIPMTATAAEVTKTAENTFRDLQIAAQTSSPSTARRWGSMSTMSGQASTVLKAKGSPVPCSGPGAGVGGHCLTKDTYHLERGVQVLGKDLLDYPGENRRSMCLPGASTTSCPPTCSGSRPMR